MEMVASHPDVDMVMAAIVGAAGLAPCLAAARAGKRLLLANKEAIVVGGELFMRAVKEGGAPLLPIDSEHSAIFQCLPEDRSTWAERIDHIVLTASGGPFRGRSRQSLKDATPEEALAHPSWVMGVVVTTNSATMVNKGLEVIEAHLLFDVPYERIEVTVHPQSIVHSMVEFVDGSTIAQCSPPNMRLPISIALDWPNRVADAGVPLDWTTASTWTFEPLDERAFPAVELARKVGRAGGSYPAVFNAANEQAVAAFHDGRIGFLDIVDTIDRVVDRYEPESAPMSLAGVLEAETWARAAADKQFPS